MKILARLLFHFFYTFVACTRPPDQVISSEGSPYMLRWWLFGAGGVDEHGERYARRVFGKRAYLHCFVHSDDDRAKHDHPSDSWRLILRNSYRELLQDGRERLFSAGSFAHSKAEHAHIVKLLPATGFLDTPDVEMIEDMLFATGVPDTSISVVRRQLMLEVPVWSLFVFGPKLREWGFWCPDGWKHWRDYERDGGCGETQ